MIMRMIAVDDEPRALKDIVDELKLAAPDGKVSAFTLPSQALLYVKEHPVDVAFIDIEMGRINGLVLAKRMKDEQPNLHIIFVTSHDKYAVAAFQLHATGYLMKPVYQEDIQRELSFLYEEKYQQKAIYVQTFGGFDVYVDNQRLNFQRRKSKELLAYLVDRRGISITTREACDILFEDGKYDISRKNYFQTIVAGMQSTLKKAGAGHMIVKKHNSLSVNTDSFECDSYRFLKGDPIAVNNYRRDYMICYSWAEFTMGILDAEIETVI